MGMIFLLAKAVCRANFKVESASWSFTHEVLKGSIQFCANLEAMRNKLGLLLMLVAIGFLVPGVTQPFFTLTGTVDKAALVELGMETLASDPGVPTFMVSISQQLVSQLDIAGELPALEKTRSIVGTVEELYQADNRLVALLIAIFSILVPVFKCLLMLISAVARQERLVLAADRIKNMISKWSMADVFVVAIIVSYLAANATQQTETLFSLQAQFMPGFYYFLTYCILSILSAQLLDQRDSVSDSDRPHQIKECVQD
ncbi:MAG: hypothetical protein ACI9KN_000723 [Gammaproteobacteria bacterium]|jgi:hypothetical protein